MIVLCIFLVAATELCASAYAFSFLSNARLLSPRSSSHLYVNGGFDRTNTGAPDKDMSNIFQANEEWKRSKLEKNPQFFEELGSGHNPRYLWIGCADARVPANEIMGEDAGTVFVVRNVANMVVNTDFNLMAALQYAVDVLKVPHIILCGHYDCGGIRASMVRKDHKPPLENWLRNIRDVYRLHREELDSIADPEARHRRLVELNVVEQCINLFKTGVVQRQRVETWKDRKNGIADIDYITPRIHACVFDPKSGDLRKLRVDFRRFIEDLHGIYDLYLPDAEEFQQNSPHTTQSTVTGDNSQVSAMRYVGGSTSYLNSL